MSLLKFKWMPFIIVLILFIQLISPLGSKNKAMAASATVEYRGMISYGGSMVGDFRVNGEQAFCIEHFKPTPPTNTPNKGISVYNNKKIAAALYWGWGGDKNIFGSDRERGVVVTSLVLSRIYTGVDAGGKSIPGYSKLYEKAMSEDVPNANINFSKSSINSSVSGNVQKTETNKFIADSSNKVSFNLPNEITLHNVTTGKNKTGGTVTLKGGDSFYLTAPLSYGKDFGTGALKGAMKELAPMVVAMKNSSYQTLSFGVFRDPLDTASFKANFEVRQKKITVQHKDKYNSALLEEQSYTRNIGSAYTFSPKSKITKGSNTYVPVSTSKFTGTLGNKDLSLTFWYNLQRTITIKHVDARDNKLLKTETETKLRGDKYSYSPKTNLKKGDYTYRPTSTAKKTGTVAGSNITLTFYYDVPLIETGLEKIQVYTAPAKDGLPVKVNLSKVNNYPATNGDMAEAKVNVALYQGSTKVASNAYTAKTLPKNIDFKVPANKLAVNQKNAYTVKIEGYSKNEIDVISDAAMITTDGYTSSERSLHTNNTSLSFTGVVMTEREIRKDMKVYNETLKVNLTKLKKEWTGYGFENPIDVIYTNDLGQKFSGEFDFYAPSSITDDTYLTYSKSGNRSKIMFEETSHKESKNQDVLTTTKRFEFPQVKVEKITGHLFSNDQVAKKDTRIKHPLIDGGRKFYTPIWGDIGTYELETKNIEPMGVHKVNVSMKQDFEIFASMYGHMDSPTREQDAIYLRPVNADDPDFPDNWTEEDKKAYFEWNKKR